MSANRWARLCRVALSTALSALVPASAATAHERAAGSESAPERPTIESLKCGSGGQAQTGCARGAFLAVRGEQLDGVKSVVFLGERGRQDDRGARPRRRSPHRLLVRVPRAAQSGPVRAVTHQGDASSRSDDLSVSDTATPAPTAPPGAGDGVFPVRGSHEFGTDVNAFGGGRGHQGQDVFADCGTPVVAARAGKVLEAETDGTQGNYAVVEAGDGTSQAYLHMLEPAGVNAGDQVAAGQDIGQVGETGNAVGCHLHFEIWTAPGRFKGGEAIDPMPDMRRWASAGQGAPTDG
jgi:murein DD-endopeptidase MepM/ murein hydrolase activator NlpD